MPEEESFLDIVKKLKLTVPILLGGIFLCGYLIYANVYPVITAIQELKVQVETQAGVLAEKQRKLDDARLQLKKQQDESTLEKEFFVPEEKGLPDDDMIAGEFEEILEIIRSNTIKMRSINFDMNPRGDVFVQGAPEKFNVAALKMEMIGTYKNFENFLKDLYKHEHFLEISKVQIEPYEKDKTILLINYEMKLYAKK
ncbi:hypothetical protein IKU74_06220 [bacterium]|nr:hypothetical protein [bacterium]